MTIKQDKPSSLHRMVKTIRSEFGTRVAKRITCSHCGKSEHVSFIPHENKPIYCRACAELELGVVDDSLGEKQEILTTCPGCKQVFSTFLLPEKKFKKPMPGATPPASLTAQRQNYCKHCYTNIRAKERDVAYKSIGVHPLVKKKTSR